MHMERYTENKTSGTYGSNVNMEASTDVTVYTSNQCLFCEQALHVARQAAEKSSMDGLHLHVIEVNIDDKPSILEEKRIMALPTTIIGATRIIGIPREDELEQHIHKAILDLS